jgi:hypothetical protein
MGALHDKMGGVRAVPGNSLDSINAISDRESSFTTLPGRDDRTRKVIAKRHRKSRGSHERKKAPAVAVGAAHVDRIDRGGLDSDLNFIGARAATRNFPNLESAARLRRETWRRGELRGSSFARSGRFSSSHLQLRNYHPSYAADCASEFLAADTSDLNA